MKNTQRKAIFLDRDGVLTVDKGYTYNIKDFELKEGVIEALKIFSQKNYLLFVVTNQSGIGRGYYTESDMHKFHNHMSKVFLEQGIKIEKIYFCPHTPGNGCDCRKPSTKFVKKAAKNYNLNLSESFVLGDEAADLEFGRNSGVCSVYILSGKEKDQATVVKRNLPAYSAANILFAAHFITSDSTDKILDRTDVRKLALEKKKSKKKIVTLNGAFDVLHRGHMKIMKEAKEQGDCLFVGLNSNESIRKSKGENRPINNISARLKTLSSFDESDYVFEFKEETPIEFLKEIKPDVHVNGSDYGEDCIEKDVVVKNGGKIYVVELVDGYSSTRLIEGD